MSDQFEKLNLDNHRCMFLEAIKITDYETHRDIRQTELYLYQQIYIHPKSILRYCLSTPNTSIL
jgi:hypothetical protein